MLPANVVVNFPGFAQPIDAGPWEHGLGVVKNCSSRESKVRAVLYHRMYARTNLGWQMARTIFYNLK